MSAQSKEESMRRKERGVWRVATMGLLIFCTALMLPGCIATAQSGRIGAGLQQEEQTDKAHNQIEKPVNVGVEEKKAVEPGARIRQLLVEAEAVRAALFANPGYHSYYVETGEKDATGSSETRSFKLITFESLEAQIRQARELYEQVLVKDPGNPQALLGLGDLALMDAMTLLSKRQQIDATLVTSEALDGEDRARLQRKKTLLEKRTDNLLAAAQAKFRRVFATNPAEPAAHLGMGISLAMSRNWNAAHQKFLQIEKEGFEPPRNRSVLYVWDGFVLERLGKRDAAIERYSKAAAFLEPYSWGKWASERVEELFLYQ
jgi:tetratricopeptide (TPR) repeat protein